MAKADHDLQIKILTIGDSSVGKTALLNQFANKQFSNAAIPTIGIGGQERMREGQMDSKREIEH